MLALIIEIHNIVHTGVSFKDPHPVAEEFFYPPGGLDGMKRLLLIQVSYRIILGYRVERSEQKAADDDQQDNNAC